MPKVLVSDELWAEAAALPPPPRPRPRGGRPPADTHEGTMLEPVLDAVATVRRCAGRPRKRPAKLHADKGYDAPRCRRACRERGVVARVARRGAESSERLGRHRWVVERTLARFGRFRRLAARYERRTDIADAFHRCAAALICLRFANNGSVARLPC